MLQSPHERRVRRVRLCAPHAGFLRAAALRLEDALRTASLPGTDTGRLVLVRRLEVGRIRPHSSPASLSAGIETQFGELFGRAVHAEHPSAERSLVVYFHDRLDAETCVALRLAAGRSTSAWFWPLAVPELRLVRGAPDPLVRFLLARGHSREPAQRSAPLVQSLVEHGCVDRLVSGLTESQGAELLQFHGWTDIRRSRLRAAREPLSTGRQPTTPCLSTAWARVLEQWVNVWPTGDPRSQWLVRIALLADNPLRSLGVSDSHQAQQLLDLAARRQLAVRKEAAEWITPSTVRRPATALHHRQLKSHAAPNEAAPPRSTSDKPHPAKQTETSAGDARRAAPATEPAVRQPDASPERHPDSRPTNVFSPTSDKRLAIDAQSDRRGSTAVPPSVAQHTAAPAERARSGRAAKEHERRTPPSDFGPPTFGLVQPADAHPARATQTSGPAWLGDAQPTSLAGLFFLVRLMDELGMSEFLRSFPAWIECRFPQLLLERIVHRMDVASDDPSLHVVSAGLSGAQTVAEFVAPTAWRMVMAEGPVRLYRSHDPSRTWWLTDASGRLPLGCGRGDRPASLEQFGTRRRMRPVHRTNRRPLDVAFLGWWMALGRACRRRTGLRCCDVVRRPGRIAATRTHVDVLFDVAQADVRIRKAGLDVDPGWVPWLGRVVSFHYLTGERRHE